jgi:hypothetical protein
LTLFLFTGIALKIYLNERPFEPRERDYALVGSFYVFAIWIGFGVYALYESAQKYLAPKVAGPIIIVASIAAPVLMASKTGMTRPFRKVYRNSNGQHTLIPCP